MGDGRRTGERLKTEMGGRRGGLCSAACKNDSPPRGEAQRFTFGGSVLPSRKGGRKVRTKRLML